MGCSEKNVPAYLHFTPQRKTYPSNRFRGYHLLFRTGFKERENPIEFPFTSTSISVCWSKLVRRKHVLVILPEKLGNHVYFGKVKELKRFKQTAYCSEGDFAGEHTISVAFLHSPVECNYSHAEILIRHTYCFKGEPKEDIIKHSDWNKSVFFKGKPKAFFKTMDLRYRANIARLISKDCAELDIPFYLKIFSKQLIVRLALLKSTMFVSLNQRK